MDYFYKLFLSFFIFTSLLSCASEPIDTKISLDGTWQFLASEDVETYEQQKAIKAWDSITVPGNWDTKEKYSTYSGKAFYRRSFEVPASWSDKHIQIHFGAVYQTAKIWLNGKLLGKHVGGYTPFEFNINQELLPGQPNELVVMADNSYKRGAWWAWGGISRTVSLEAFDKARMKYQHIDATPDFEKGQISFVIKHAIENLSNENNEVKVMSYIDGTLLGEVPVTISSLGTIETKMSYPADLSLYKLWDLDHPNLYKLTSKLKVNGKIVHTLTDNFGIRKIEARGEQLFLNNKPLRENGLNRVHDHPKYGNTEPKHIVEADMEDIKALGGRFSRLMHAPLSKTLLDFCDREGYLLIQEIPVWGDDDPQTFKDSPLAKKWMREMIERDFNHPSVIGWSVGNELRDPEGEWADKTLTKDQYEYIDSMLDYVEELDQTRLKTYVSLTAYGDNVNLTNEPFEKLDFICINSYGDAVKAVTKTHKKFPGKPIFMSEIGRSQIGPAPDSEFSEELIADLKKLKEFPYLVGVSLWSYNDYRSNYKGTPKSGFREWGVVSENREKKKAYYQIQEINKNWQLEPIKP